MRDCNWRLFLNIAILSTLQSLSGGLTCTVFFSFVFVCFMLNSHAAFVGFKCQSRGIFALFSYELHITSVLHKTPH